MVLAAPLSTHASSCDGSGCAVSEVTIVMYHHVRVFTNPKDRLGQRLSLTPKLFHDQLDALSKEGFTPIRFADLKNGTTTAKKPIILTFDDGYDDMMTNALPELKAHGMVAVFFIISGKVNKPGYLTLDQIRGLRHEGMEIGAHTVTHPNLARLKKADQEKEIAGSINALEDMLESPILSFAYPMGKYNALSQSILKKTPIAYAVTTHHGVGDLKGNPLVLKRIRVQMTTDGKHLLTMIKDVLKH